MYPLRSRLPVAATEALKYLLGVRPYHDRNRTRADPKPTFISDGVCWIRTDTTECAGR